MSQFVRTTPTARKEHRCDTCGRTIRVGEKYVKGAGFDDTAWTWKDCRHCRAMMDARWVEIVWDDDGYDLDTIREWEPQTVAALRVKAHWCRQWTRRDGSLVDVQVAAEPA